MERLDLAEALIQAGNSVHLLGIGGVGMAGLALLLAKRGLRVSGCDLQENRLTRHLRSCGISVEILHHPNHLDGEIDWVIRSSAVAETDPELCYAQERGLPLFRRGEVLPVLLRDRLSIAVAGTHGKTTTTAMIAQALECGYFVGGEVGGFPSVAKDGALLVVEADESDGTLVHYAPDFSVLTNIEFDHMEHFASEADFLGCFERLIAQTKQKVYYAAEDPLASKLCSGHPHCEPFSLPAEPFDLPLPGKHNQWNAAATLAVCRNWKTEEEVRSALKKMAPVRRRLEILFHANGIRVISDYAHHPTEIAALVQAVKEENPRRIFAIFQPHRYTRTKALGADFPPAFSGVEEVWLLPVYAASEKPLPGGTAQDLQRHFSAAGIDAPHLASTFPEAWNALWSRLESGDVLLVIGAGDLDEEAREIISLL